MIMLNKDLTVQNIGTALEWRYNDKVSFDELRQRIYCDAEHAIANRVEANNENDKRHLISTIIATNYLSFATEEVDAEDSAPKDVNPGEKVETIMYDLETLDLLPDVRSYIERLGSNGSYPLFMIMLSPHEVDMILKDDYKIAYEIMFEFNMRRPDEKHHDDIFIGVVDVTNIVKNYVENHTLEETDMFISIPIVINGPTMSLITITSNPTWAEGKLYLEKEGLDDNATEDDSEG